MKRYLISLTIALLAGWSLSSCSDWLDYTPKDQQTHKQQFSTLSGFYDAINGIYTQLGSNSLYGYNLSYGPLDVMAQCYDIPEINKYMKEFQISDWTDGKYAPGTFSTIWFEAYNKILNANLVLEAAELRKDEVVPEKHYKLIRGEMLAVRAMLHFDMLRLFAPMKLDQDAIPFNDKTDAEKSKPITGEDLLTTKLLPDLEEALTLLKEVDPVITEGVLNSDGGEAGNRQRYRQLRLNYYATILLKARVHIWMGDYTNALKEAQKITDDPAVKQWFPFVDPSTLLANNTNPDRVFSTECLFGFYENKFKDIFLRNFSGTLDVSKLLQPRKGYIDIMFRSTSDYRRQSQWTGSASSFGSGYDFVKYKGFIVNNEEPEFWATFFGLMRISEAYYIAAESALSLENTAAACRYLNTILEARGVENIDLATPAAEILKEIKMEYLREFRGEGQIYFMLKRFDQGLGKFDRGDTDFCGSMEMSYDRDRVKRYNVPIPSDENN